MLRNYLTIAFRNLVKNKVFSSINIMGLALGMAVAMLIGLWVWDELSYNHCFPNYQRIASLQVRSIEPLEKKVTNFDNMQQPLAEVLRIKYGHLFKHVIILNWEGDYSIRIGENHFTKHGRFVQNGIIDLLSLKMLRGSKESMNDKQGIVISASMAKALFGDKDPINEPIKLDNRIETKIAGVYADIPKNSSFGDIDFFGNFEHQKAYEPGLKNNENNWGNTSQLQFVQLADNVSLEQANAAIKDVFLKDTPSDIQAEAKIYQSELWLHPMKNWYLYAIEDGYLKDGRINFVWLFGIVGAFVLLLACINFMNLSTARSEKRAKEVGIRKAIGSLKSQLIKQFLSESLLVVLFAFVLSLSIVTISISAFNELADKRIELPYSNAYFWLLSGAFLLITSLLSGIYPAFYLSSFKPIKVLKGTIRTGKYASLPRKILVVVQFTVSVVLIIGTIIVYRQIQYVQNRPVGYNRESLVRIPMNDLNFQDNMLTMKNELLASGVASNVAFSNSPVTEIWNNWGGFTWKGKDPQAESSFAFNWIDEDYGKTIQWKILEGRDFSRDFGTDSSKIIVNKSAIKYMGLKNPIGEFVTQDGGERNQIIGIVEDVVSESPYEPVRQSFYRLEKDLNTLSQMQIKVSPNMSMKAALAKIEAIQKKTIPSAPFMAFFVDDDYASKFQAEQRIGRLATLFAMLAIFISCLGLFGLASFIAEQRTKEIGIRKVLGASIANLWQMLSKDFVVLVIISCVVASPVAYYFMNEWIQKYTYHAQISWWIFAAAGAGALAITMLTVSFQAIKAALANPVKSLKSE
jgi:putative ABC transport system permease protein